MLIIACINTIVKCCGDGRKGWNQLYSWIFEASEAILERRVVGPVFFRFDPFDGVKLNFLYQI